MGHEISQFDIPDRQLLANNCKSGFGIWTDIGEAKIARTLFGRAKVRVIRERDKKRRAWLLTALLMTLLTVIAWQGWNASQQSEPLAAPPLPLSERVRVSEPVFQPDYPPSPDNSKSLKNIPKTPSQIVIGSMITRREPPPQRPVDLRTPVQMPAKPITTPTTTPATNSSNPKSPVNVLPSARLPTPEEPTETSAAPQRTLSPATGVILPAGSLARKNTATPSPEGDTPVNAQP